MNGISYLKFYLTVIATVLALIFFSLYFFYKFFLLKETIPEKIIEKPAYVKDYGSEDAPEAPFPMPEIKTPVFPEKICDVRNYGAVENGETLNTKAFEKAISDCSQSGGGYVVVPEGKWLTGKIHLKSNINLHFEDGAEIIFSTSRDNYLPAEFTRFQGMELYNFSPLIYAKDAENVALTGKGKLIGNGKDWVDWSLERKSEQAQGRLFKMAFSGKPVEQRNFGNEESGLRPSFIQFVNCKNILLEDIYVTDGPMWTIHPIYSENIIIRKLKIDTSLKNTDGIVIDSSKNVYIKNNSFSTGDDSIAIKSGLEEDGFRVNRPSENIFVSDNHFTKGHTALAIGSELSGGIRNVLFEKSKVFGNDNGFRIKTTPSRGGFVENIWIRDIDIQGVPDEASIIFDAGYRSRMGSEIKRNFTFENINLKNIYAKSPGGEKIILIEGDKRGAMKDILFENIRIDSKDGIDLNRASNITFLNISLESETSGPALKLKNCANIDVRNLACQKSKGYCVSVEGSHSYNIDLRENSFGKSSILIEKSARNSVMAR